MLEGGGGNIAKLRHCLGSTSHLSANHSWASASRSMPPLSAFQHPVSQSGKGAFLYRNEIPYSSTELVLAPAFLFIPVPYWLDAGQSDIPAFKKRYTLHVHTASIADGERDTHVVNIQTDGSEQFKSDTPCTFIDSCWWCYSCYMILNWKM
jgi:hypothetical protein